MMKSNFLTMILILLLAPGLFAQCRGGSCAVQQQQQYWYYVGQYPNGYYVIWQNGQWVAQIPETQAEPKPECKEQNFGVDKDKLSGKDSYSFHTEKGSTEISQAEAHKIVGSNKLEDDSNKLRITVIGDDGMQKQVIADINTLLRDINDWAIVRGYAPGHWSLEPGFVQSGNPTVYCQAPNGKVLHRQDDYSGGGEDLAGALRKAKQSYDAKKDPDLRTPQFPLGDGPNKLLSYGLAAAAGAGAMFFAKRRKTT